MTELARRFEIGNCLFKPYDPVEDGVGYSAKIDVVQDRHGKFVPVEPHTFESQGLKRRHLKENSILDTTEKTVVDI